MPKVRAEELSITVINEKIQELQEEQLRIIIILMASGKEFAEAYQIALSFQK